MRDVIDRMQAMGVATDRIRLCGGGARSRVWAADTRRPLPAARRSRRMSTTPRRLGAAVLACVAAGLVGSVDEGAGRLPGHIAVTEPNPAKAAVYEDAYGRYRSLFDALRPLYAG